MSIANLLRRALVHYSRCSGRLTLPPSDLKAGKSDWANYMAEEHLRTNPQMLALLPKDFLKNVPHSL